MREDLSLGTPKKLLSQFSTGFPKTWSRGANQERRRLRTIQDMKDIDWHDLPFVGIEFSAIEDIYKQPFSFPHLTRELQEGILSKRPYPIYLFQGAQPCWSDREQTMRNVPYIVAVDCAVPPPDKLVYHTLQLAKHEVIDMKSQPSYARYEWIPYIPLKIRNESGVDRLPVQCFILGWTGRGAQFQNMQEADVHKIEFLHPYVLLPQEVEKMEAPVVTCVDFEWTHEGKKYQIVFDKEIDRLATYIPEFLEDNQLQGQVAEEVIKEQLQKAFREKRAQEESAFQRIKDEVAKLSPEQQQALREMKTYKFYPHHPELVIEAFVDDGINPYFGKASQVLLPTREDVERVNQERQEELEATMTLSGRRGRSTASAKTATTTESVKRGRDSDQAPDGDVAEPQRTNTLVLDSQEVEGISAEPKKLKLDE